ncbi:hypothetical protein [Kocuria sp. CNJ-770]|nr:hypothetical protein [Kocuria sp. CNJ-770]
MSVLDDVIDRIGNRFFGEREGSAGGDRMPGLTAKGFDMADGGRCSWVEAPPEFAATSAQTAGLWPYCVGTSSPLIGAPLGRNTNNGSVVCGDPISLFIRGTISSPSGFIMGLNGRGKSSVTVRICIYLSSLSFVPLILGDLKPDYVGMIKEIGGQVIRVGPGIGSVNPLDAGPLWNRVDELPVAKRNELLSEIHTRRVNTVRGLLELARGRGLDTEKQEPTVLSMAVRVATVRAEAEGRQPLLGDLVTAIREAPAEMQAVTLANDAAEFRAESKSLVKGLIGLLEDGPFGDVFCKPTTRQMQVDRPACFDVSGVDISDEMMRAAIQIVCWAYGQAGVSAAKTLAVAGLEPERHHLMIMDELWQTLRASELLVHQIDALTRLNRQKGLGQIMITHTMKDLTLSTEQLSEIARGFLERSSVKYFGGLARNEMELLEQVLPLSQREKDLLVEWSAEGATDPRTGQSLPPPGRGRFMMKLGENAPGVPFKMNLTDTEHRIHDTNEAWVEAMARARA